MNWTERFQQHTFLALWSLVLLYFIYIYIVVQYILLKLRILLNLHIIIV